MSGTKTAAAAAAAATARRNDVEVLTYAQMHEHRVHAVPELFPDIEKAHEDAIQKGLRPTPPHKQRQLPFGRRKWNRRRELFVRNMRHEAQHMRHHYDPRALLYLITACGLAICIGLTLAAISSSSHLRHSVLIEDWFHNATFFAQY